MSQELTEAEVLAFDQDTVGWERLNAHYVKLRDSWLAIYAENERLKNELVSTLCVSAKEERDQLRTDNERLRDNTQRLVSGFLSHLADLITRIGPARRPEDIKATLEEIHNAYNSWADKSAEAERDQLRAELARRDAALDEIAHYASPCVPELNQQCLSVIRDIIRRARESQKEAGK